jgi:hypothetical protein
VCKEFCISPSHRKKNNWFLLYTCTKLKMYSCLNCTLSKPKTCLNHTDFTVPSTKCLYNLNLCKPNTCLNWTNSSIPKGFGLDRFYCIYKCILQESGVKHHHTKTLLFLLFFPLFSMFVSVYSSNFMIITTCMCLPCTLFHINIVNCERWKHADI